MFSVLEKFRGLGVQDLQDKFNIVFDSLLFFPPDH